MAQFIQYALPCCVVGLCIDMDSVQGFPEPSDALSLTKKHKAV